MFDLSITKILILGVLALVIFGPERLPRIAAQAGRALRDLRKLADNAREDLTESLGPEFRDFDFNDLNPRAFVRKHLLEGMDEEDMRWSESGGDGHPELDPPDLSVDGGYNGESEVVQVHEPPPFDAEAT